MSSHETSQVRYTPKQAAAAYGVEVKDVYYAIQTGALPSLLIPSRDPAKPARRRSVSDADMRVWVESWPEAS